jgi:hypothetical protein
MDIKPFLDAFPLPAKRGILSDIEKEATEKAVDALIAKPAAAAKALADKLIEPGTEGNDIQARHALHAVAIRVPTRGEESRSAFCKALAGTLTAERPARVKAYIIRQLQLCGGKEVAAQVGAFLTVDGIADDAAQALLAIRDGAAEQFRSALPKVNDNAGLRRNILHGLAQLADQPSKETFVAALADKDEETRLLALWGLCQLADPSTLDTFLAAEQKETGFARTKSASLCLQLAEKLPKEEAAKAYRHLQATRKNPEEQYLQDLVSAALSEI